MKRKCTLLITHSCNLNCVYCYEHHKSSARMSLETARRILQQELTSSNPVSEGIDFHFLGGEPLLNFELIRDLCQWAWTRVWNVPFHFYVITNGTLLDTAKKDWFEAHKDRITVDLSVDGFDAEQFANRGCFARDLPLEWVRRCWPQSRFKMTVSRQTLPRIADAILAMTRQGYNVSITPAMGIRWTAEDVREYGRQLSRIVDFYQAVSDVRIWPQLLRSIDPLFDDGFVQTKCCGSGDSAITYDVDGTDYPCVMFTPLVSGNEVRAELEKIHFDDPVIFADDACAGCFIKNMCKTCYGLNLQERGCLASRDKSLCGMYRAEIYAICRFQRDLLRSLQRPLTALERVRLQRTERSCDLLES